MPHLEFSDRQRKTIAAAVTLLAVLVIIGVVVWSLTLLGRFVAYFSGVFLPLVVAGLLAMLFQPVYGAVLRAAKKPAIAVVVVFLCILIPVAGIVWFFGAIIAEQAGGLIEKAPQWWDRVQVEIQQRTPSLLKFWHRWELGEKLRTLLDERGAEWVESVGNGLLAAGAGFSRTVSGFLGWVVLPVYFVFFLTTPRAVRPVLASGLPFLKPSTREDVAYLAGEFVNIMVAFFRGQVVIALLQGVLYAVGFALAGLQFGIVLGLLMGLLNIIPYLGSLLGLAMVLPTAWFQPGGGVTLVAMTAVVIVAVQCIEGYYLTPKIMGNRTGLHPVAIIFAIFFWGTALSGLLGMILAIPLTAFLVVFWRLLKAKYIKELL